MRKNGIRFQFAVALGLVSFTFPVGIALAQKEQMVAGSLMSELTAMNVGQIDLHRNGNDFTVTRPDGSSYEFTNVVRHKNGASATASEYNSKGVLIERVTIHNGTNVPDQNRIDFEVSSNGALTTGSITGLKSFPNQAIASIYQNGTSELFRVNYAGLDTRGVKTIDTVSIHRGQNADKPITVSSMETTGSRVAIVIALIAALFVAVTCLMFGWWGCDG